jgi:hypothetical protein
VTEVASAVQPQVDTVGYSTLDRYLCALVNLWKEHKSPHGHPTNPRDHDSVQKLIKVSKARRAQWKKSHFNDRIKGETRNALCAYFGPSCAHSLS